MWRKLNDEKRMLRHFDCSVSFSEYGVSIWQNNELKGGFTYPSYDNYEEFADEVFKRIQTRILDITFHQGMSENET